MKPAPFEYHSPGSVEEAVELLAELPDAEVLAGNQSLGIVMANRLAKPDHLVDVNAIDDLSYVEVGEDEVRVGATTRHRDVERSAALAEALPLLPESAASIAGPVVRNRGTLGGSIAEADPAGNYPCVAVALDADLHLVSTDGERSVPAREFFVAYMFTDLGEDELIESISISREPFPMERTGMAFVVQKPAPQTWPTISAAAVVRVEDPDAAEPTVEEARLTLANAADVPLQVPDAEATVEGGPLTDDALDAAADAAIDAARPQGEMHADEEYKRELAGEYARRSLTIAGDRATES
jgi:carbon-monoxide dehydrogenase medium subunit